MQGNLFVRLILLVLAMAVVCVAPPAAPAAVAVSQGTDSDGDGFSDDQDPCPTVPASSGGCPDSDGDGSPDPQDPCPTQAGPGGGCPAAQDSDFDGYADQADACPTAMGPPGGNGCPPASQTQPDPAPAPKYVRAIGSNRIAHGKTFASFAILTESDPKMVMTVDGRTQRRLKLKSGTLAKGAFRECGESGCVTLTASSAVWRAVQRAKTLTVTIKMTVTTPVRETVTKKVVLSTAKATKNVVLSTSADPLAAGGGRGR